MKQTYYVPNVAEPITPRAGKFREIKMEERVVKRRVSHDMYTSPASGSREIIANEITAAVLAKKAGANPHIEITVRPDTVRIWGIDSLGITWDTYEKVLATLGRSGNFDGKTPGQFGLGRVAYTTISDHMLLETHHRNGDSYSVVGVEGMGYQEDLPKPDIPYGTRITMAPRKADVNGIISMVRKIAARSPIPITLVTAGRTEHLERRPLATPDHYLKAKLKDVEFATAATIRDDDATPGRYGVGRRHDAEQDGDVGATPTAYLCGMPVQFRYRGRYRLTNLVLDIQDERKYPPTSNRESMTEEAEVAVSGMIDAEIGRRMAKFPKRFKAAMNHPDRRMAAVLLENHPHHDWFEVEVPVYGHKREVKLGEVPGSPVLNCPAFLVHWTEAVRRAYPDTAFVRGVSQLQSITDFMEERGIEPLRVEARRGPGAEKDASIVFHTKDGIKRCELEDVPTCMASYRIFRLAGGGELNKYRPHLRKGWAFTIHDAPGAIDLRKVLASVRRRKFTTSRGRMTGAALLASGRKVFRTNRASLVEIWGDGLDDAPTILVHDDGSSNAYAELSILSEKIHGRISIHGWMYDYEHAMETYLRLDNPILKKVLRDSYSSREAEFCDEFLRLDGKEPIAHGDDCRCGDCRPARGGRPAHGRYCRCHFC